ncbi:MAG: Ig-like domain-containing protein, partial [Acidimicrobiales bacterium]
MLNLSVAKATPTAVTEGPPSPATGVTTSTPVTLSATVTTQSSGNGPTGMMTFSTCGTPPCTAPLVPTNFDPMTGTHASATAMLTTTFTTAGMKSITATYGGDGNYTGSGPSAAVNVTVTQAGGGGSFTVSGPANPAAIPADGMSHPVAITVAPSGGFTGMVTVNCPASLPPGVTCTAPAAINVTTNAAVMGSMVFAVAAPSGANAMASIPSANRTLYAAGMTPAGIRNGWWTLTAGTGLAAVVLLLLPGRKKVRAALGLSLICALSFALGCGGGGGGGGVVNPVATTTHFTVTSPTKGASGTTFSFTATVTGGTPTGQVQLFDNGAATGNAVSVSNGMATVTTAGLTVVGTHSISAHYLGDSTTLASQSAGTLNVTLI